MSYFEIAKLGTPLTSDMKICYIGLGSNLEKPMGQVMTALQSLDKLLSCKILSISSIYRSKPIGPQEQPKFINAVVKLGTHHPPDVLLTRLQQLEESQGRIRHPKEKKWGPRIIDLDLLLYEKEIIDTEFLTIPHKEIKNRPFVIIPLHEIEPDLIIPGDPEISIKELTEGLAEKELNLERLLTARFDPKPEDAEEDPIDHFNE